MLVLSQEERVSRKIIFENKDALVLQIGEAKNLEKAFILTLQLLEAGFNLILVLNMKDEAEKEGIEVDQEKLKEFLGIPIVGTVSVSGLGVNQLKEEIVHFYKRDKKINLIYPSFVEEAIAKISLNLEGEYNLSKRTISLLLLEEDVDIWEEVKRKEKKDNLEKIYQIKEELKQKLTQPLSILLI